jgi:hypothetical protein
MIEPPQSFQLFEPVLMTRRTKPVTLTSVLRAVRQVAFGFSLSRLARPVRLLFGARSFPCAFSLPTWLHRRYVPAHVGEIAHRLLCIPRPPDLLAPFGAMQARRNDARDLISTVLNSFRILLLKGVSISARLMRYRAIAMGVSFVVQIHPFSTELAAIFLCHAFKVSQPLAMCN